MHSSKARTTDTQWRHKSKISEKLGRCGRQNMLPPYLKIWEWEWIFGRAVKDVSSLGVRSPCLHINTNVLSKSIKLDSKYFSASRWISRTLNILPRLRPDTNMWPHQWFFHAFLLLRLSFFQYENFVFDEFEVLG